MSDKTGIETTDSDATPLSPVASDQTAGGVRPQTPPPALIIESPCVIDDLDEAIYHAPWTVPAKLGGSLSNSGAKTLATKTAAHFQHDRLNGRANKRHFDIGHAVHARVLGVGQEVVRLPFENYRTKEAQERRDAAYAAGMVPLLAHEVDEVGLMAEAVLKLPEARTLFENEAVIEQSLFWRDAETGVYLRCRPDSRITTAAGRVIAIDLKSAENANPAKFGKKADDFGYCQQDPFYRDGLAAHGIGDENTAFVFVVVETSAPYLTSIVQLDADAVAVGRARTRRAIDLFDHCTQTYGAEAEWPGYSTGITSVSLPKWTLINELETA